MFKVNNKDTRTTPTNGLFQVVLDGFGLFQLVLPFKVGIPLIQVQRSFLRNTFNVHSHAQNTENKNTLQILQTVEFALKHNSANIPKLVCQRSIDIARV